MANFSVFISGSIHQGHECFSDISRGRQCSFISFLAVLCAQDLPVEEWSAATVDHILVEGDRLYLDALQIRSIPDTETLSLNYLPDTVCWSMEANTDNLSVASKTKQDSQFCAESQTYNPLIWADNNNKSLTWVINTDLPAVEAHNKPLWVINYKDFYQGEIARHEHENEVPYFTLRSALMNAFSDNDCAFIILEGYVMGLIKTADRIYLFDSHARNCFGMPDPNGTAAVMKFANISKLEEYLCSLSLQLNTAFFKIVPVAFEKITIQGNVTNKAHSTKNKPNESETLKVDRLQKAREYKRRRILEETENQREIRLKERNAYQKHRLYNKSESQKQIRLEKKNASQKRRNSI